MFKESAQFYDLIYSRFKNYDQESRQIASLLERIHPKAKTILDVACGTGEHASYLSNRYGYRVDGIDIEPAFVRMAQGKTPQGSFMEADMREFDTGKRYDVVMCLFSSIGYAKTLESVKKTLGNFRRHLGDGGVVIVEPWFTPEAWKPGLPDMNTVDEEGLKICRMSYSSAVGRLSSVHFEYLIGTTEGIKRTAERHDLGLFTREEMQKCFYETGFAVEYDPAGIFGRGLYVSRPVA